MGSCMTTSRQIPKLPFGCHHGPHHITVAKKMCWLSSGAMWLISGSVLAVRGAGIGTLPMGE